MSSEQPALLASGALSHLRVLELGEMPASYTSSYLGALGADVVKIEPPGGDPNRLLPPFAGDIEDKERSIPFLNANLNKRSIVLDLGKDDGRRVARALLERADILVAAGSPKSLESAGLGEEELRALNQGLVSVLMTPFGLRGPYSEFVGNDPVMAAMSGVMMSQGDATRSPVVPPCQISYQLAAIHGAYLSLAALRHRRRTGLGQTIDLSLQEALTFASGSAVVRYSQRREIPIRPGGSGGAFNIYRCKDGRYINIAIFMPNHWHVLTRDWMEDPVLSDPEWDSTQYRTDNQDVIKSLLSEFVARFEADEFVSEAQRRGLACSPVNTFEDFVTNEHMRARGWFQQVEHPVVGTYEAPGAPFKMSATPWRIYKPTPLLDQHRAEILEESETLPKREREQVAPTQADASRDAPLLEGIRVADVTRAFAGPTGTMFLGFYGAEVIKVESESLQANREVTSPFYPDMNRNKLSVTIDLRHPDGKELFGRLVERADVVVENFSATVMKRLGLGFDDLRKVKSDIIQIGMPGMGSDGPLKGWVTYGNSLQAFTGLTLLWGHSDSPMDAHAKGVIPDYAGAAYVALSTAAAIEHRDKTGEGQSIEIAQVDGQAALLGPSILNYTINARAGGSVDYSEPLTGNFAPFGCYPCLYEDTWIVVACESEDQWKGLVAAMGEPPWALDARFKTLADRRTHRRALDDHVEEWTRGLTPYQAMWLLQAKGVPAGVAMNGEQLYSDMHLRARGHIVEIAHGKWGTLAHSGLPAVPSLSSASAAKPTPWIGDDDDYVFLNILGLSAEQLQAVKKSGAAV